MSRPFLRGAVAAALTACATLLCCSPAGAQAVYNWTGFYAGIHGGGAWSKTQGVDDPASPFPQTTSQNLRGAFGGAQFGYQQQFGAIVLGNEVSASYGRIAGSGDCFPGSGDFVGFGETLDCKSKQDWTFQWLNRIGYAVGDGRFLPFVSGGLVLSRFGMTKRDNDFGFVETWSRRQFIFGAGFGGGFQYALGNGYFFGVDYFYTRFFAQDFTTIGDCGCTFNANQNLTSQSIRLSLNYTFGSPPVEYKTAAPAATPGIYDWSGFYAGVSGGGERNRQNGSYDLFYAKTSQEFGGGVAGLQLGYNRQFGRVVLGTEFAGSWSSAHGSKDCIVGDLSGPPIDEILCRVKKNWTGMFLARFGYALGDGRFLPYILSGVALTQFKMDFSADFFGGGLVMESSQSRTLAGGTVGAGFQYAVGNGLSVGIEYLYTKYAAADFSAPVFANGAQAGVATQRNDLSSQSLRFVANYKFNDVPFAAAGTQPRYDWSGFYAGLHAATSWSHATGSDQAAVPFGDLTSQHFSGQSGGGQFGYNRQYGRFVLGSEISFSLGGARGSGDCFQFAAMAAPGVDFNCRIKQNWNGQYLAKLGYALDDGRILSYLLGGISLAEIGVNRQFVDNVFVETANWGQSRVLVGPVFGAGVQYALRDNLSLGLEYLYTHYGMQQFTPNATGNFSGFPQNPFPATFTQDVSSQSLRLVLNYKFDSAAFTR